MANVIKHKRGSGSDPVASDLVVGEVAIRTDVGKLFTKMDNGTVAEIAGGGSDIAINTLSSSSATGGGSATFNGSAYRFTLSAPPSVSAQQLLVSINGVIQKPVAGTGQPSEGFSVDGTDIILGDAPATGSDFFILTFKSLGVSEPADNSVTSAKIVDGAIVNADINASAAIAGTKISPDFGSQDVVTTGNITSGGTLKTTGNVLTVEGATPRLNLTDTNNNSDFEIGNTNGTLNIADSTNSVNRLRVLSNGTVIVTGNLDVGAGLDVTGTITGNNLTLSDNDPIIQFTDANNDPDYRILVESGIFRVQDTTNGNAERLAISSSGRVGIGTASPSRQLHLVGSNPMVLIEGSGGNGRQYALASSDDTTGAAVDGGNPGSFAIYDDTANAARLVINSSGNVGIGTTSMAGKLNVQGSAGGVALQTTDATNSTFRISHPSAAVTLLSGGSSQHLALGTGFAEKMRIDSAGRLLVGSSSISNNGRIQGFIDHGSTAGESGITSVDTTAMAAGVGGEISFMGKTNTSGDYNYVGHVRGIKENATSGNTACALTFHTRPTLTAPQERMRIDSSGDIFIGTSTDIAPTNGTNLCVSDGTVARLILEKQSTRKFEIGVQDFINIYDQTADAERMRIDSSGNMFLGLSSTSFPKKLNVQGSSGAIIALKNHDTTSYAADTNTSIEFGLNTGNTGNQNGACEIRAFKENGTNGNNLRGLSFYTGVNGGSPQKRLVIEGTGTLYHRSESSTNASLTLRKITSGADSIDYLQCRSNSNGLMAKIGGNGGISNVQSNDTNLSDQTMKKNIVDCESIIEKFKQWKLRKFNYNSDLDGTPLTYGLIAQEVETLHSDLVNEDFPVDESGKEVMKKTVKDHQLMMIGFKALQEAIAKIETLEAKVEALEAK